MKTAVYIRFTLDGRCQFWKTSKVVSSQNVKSKSEITCDRKHGQRWQMDV